MSPALVAAVTALVVLVSAPPRLPLRRSRFRLSRLTRSSPAARRAAELEFVEALAAELRAGRDPMRALVAADRAGSVLVSAAASAAARSGGDVPEALRTGSGRSDLLRGVAACWEVSAGSGAGLASSLTTLVDSARDSQRVRDELRAGLAEPRATAVVLSLLPLLGLGLGAVLGADPLAWLLGSRAGLVVLAAGLALEAVGAWWAWRIASSLESLL